MFSVLTTLILAAFLGSGCRSTPSAETVDRELAPGLSNRHAEVNAAVDSQNVSRLKLAWQIQTASKVTQTPLVARGRVYVGDWGGVITAADLKTGAVLWLITPEKPRLERPWHGFCGTGVLADGKLFEASAEGNAFAFDATSGRLLWKERFATHADAGNRGRLLYHNGLLYIPVATVETSHAETNTSSLFCGGVVALDAADGHVVWRQDFISIGQMPGRGLVGVMVPDGFALDPETGLLFLATSHLPSLHPSAVTDSVLALDARTGAVRWSFPLPPFSPHQAPYLRGPGHGFVAAPQLFSTRIGGRLRRLVGVGDVGGGFWVLDRETGQVLWRATLGSKRNERSIIADASIAGGRVFLWDNQGAVREGSPLPTMDVLALDAANGRIVWFDPNTQPAGAAVAAGFLSRDTYVVGSLDGRIRAYGAASGRKIWTSPFTAPIESSLLVAGDRLLFSSARLPSSPGQMEGGAVFAFALPMNR